MKHTRNAIAMLLAKYRAVVQKTWWLNLSTYHSSLLRGQKGICAAALFVSLAASPGPAAAGEIFTYSGEGNDPHLQTILGTPSSLAPRSLTDIAGNSCVIDYNSGANRTDPYSVYGSFSLTNSVENNLVTVRNGTILGQVYGGYSNFNAFSNTVMVSGGTVQWNVYGGYNNGITANNTVNVNGGTIQGDVYGGSTENGTADSNTVMVSSGTISDVYGGFSRFGAATGNIVTISDGLVKYSVYGGVSTNGTATSNTVTVNGGTIQSNVYGGFSVYGAAIGNIVNVNGGTVQGSIYGGFTTADNATVATSNNTIRISGTPNLTTSLLSGGNSPNSSGNTLIVDGYRGSVGGVRNFQNYIFNLPASFTNQSPIITVVGATPGNITNAKINITIDSASSLDAGSSLTLFSNVIASGDTVAANKGLTTYGASLSTVSNNTLVATLGASSASPQAKAVAEGHLTGMIAVNMGQDLASGQGMVGLWSAVANLPSATQTGAISQLAPTLVTPPANAANMPGTIAGQTPAPGQAVPFQGATAPGNEPGQASAPGQSAPAPQQQQQQQSRPERKETEANGKNAGSLTPMVPFTAMNASSVRFNTGSHVDMNGVSLLVGLGRNQTATDGSLATGFFLETGRGSYTSYNGFANLSAIHGSGKSNYLGAGFLAHRQKADGSYIEGSLRAGHAKSEFSSGDLSTAVGANTDFSVSAPYYGLHIGIGQKKLVGPNKTLDTYTRLLWSHQNPSSATVAGSGVDFDAVNSYRWQAGLKLGHKISERATLQTGLSYQYEFGGDANATTAGNPIDSPSLKGGTFIGELAMTIEPQNITAPRLTFGLQGFAGKCEGIAGNIEATWKF